MKRLLTFLVVLALIGYLSFKGAVWWLADQRLADAQQAIEELGVIDRGNIRSDLVQCRLSGRPRACAPGPCGPAPALVIGGGEPEPGSRHQHVP